MDWEAPVDAWYVYLAVSLVSVAIAGVVLGFPTGAPPDANRAANTIEPVAGSTTEASATWEYDAETIVIDGTTLELANEHGISHASLNYGVVVPVNDSKRLANITRGAEFEAEYGDELADEDTHAVETFLSEVTDQYEKNSDTRLTASDELVARQVSVDPADDNIRSFVEVVNFESIPSDWKLGGYVMTGIGTVQGSYSGIDGNSIEMSVDGDYAGPSGSSISDAVTDQTFHSGEGEFSVDIESSDTFDRPGDSPVDVTIEFDNGGTCVESLDPGSEGRCTNEISRSADFDASAPFVEHKRTTEMYHVTLVVV
ncbi:hypothetical protein GS429_12045 [Natronorubrum sp. JWXQ-INN-674]|uniref:Uncharacterized protein n=1 Tax=Natronorubrum halalkaliphilum TaxID=2691917 RepID=A0A6B0VNJ4_9EURY|nr:hypothetical protein [Natronorubrum halalkaliphilum]MXV62783.1 hypothetical protein [Natronorubrum halalkaliphilum]